MAAKRSVIGNAFGDADQRRALGAGRVHDGAHVVHARLELRDPRRAVGEPGAALVEEDQPPEPGEQLVAAAPTPASSQASSTFEM